MRVLSVLGHCIDQRRLESPLNRRHHQAYLVLDAKWYVLDATSTPHERHVGFDAPNAGMPTTYLNSTDMHD
jgi:hypothetical protein